MRAGDKLTPEVVGIAGGGYEITVESVSADRIVVAYSGMVMDNSNGTINLTAPRQGRCMIQIAHCMRLSTPTMDGGTSVAVTLDRIE